MSKAPDLSDYKEVSERIAEFEAKHPEGSLRPLNPDRPYAIEEIDGRCFVIYVAAAFRTPDDRAPGVGAAWEPFPGRTPYTKDSELQNAETSAWGRAIIAALASDSKKGVASRDEVRNRREAVETLSRDMVTHLKDRIDDLPPEQRRTLRERWNGMSALGGYRLETVPAVHVDLIEFLVNEAEESARLGEVAGTPSEPPEAKGDGQKAPGTATSSAKELDPGRPYE